MKAYERLIKYVKYHTTSDETSGTHPSTGRQLALAEALAAELRSLGACNVYVSDTCYVYASLPASASYEGSAKIGFIAHIDTSPDFCGEGINPIVHENYDGGDISLGCGRVLSPKTFPHLKALRGRTLITTDGTTLLGADDKAGVAEIMTLIERLREENIPHGELRFAFTPDEEIGEGSDNFDIQRFDADFAYTVDGGAEGSLEYENFNAAGADFIIHGFNIHPGDAKDKMINAALVAAEINAMLPADEIPAKTAGYEGFFHLTDISGNVEESKISYIVRDHDEKSFTRRISLLSDIEMQLNEKYSVGTVELHIKEQYRNMKEKIEPCIHLIENAKAAISAVGLIPRIEPIRGGTDGARLSFMGLPCPNLGTGGYAFHGPFEHVSVEGMDLTTEILIEIVKIYRNHK